MGTDKFTTQGWKNRVEILSPLVGLNCVSRRGGRRGPQPQGYLDGAPAAVRRQALVRAKLTQAPCPRPAHLSS